MTPPLLLVAHGSRDPATAPALEALTAAVSALLPDTAVQLAWIEFGAPLVSALQPFDRHEDVRPIVVPLLLAHGMHLEQDMPAEADVTPPLGPDPQLTAVLLDQVAQAGIAAGCPLVLAATGSKHTQGRTDVEQQARWLEGAWGAPVSAAFVTSSPSIADATAELTAATGTPPAVVGYFLAPGRLPTASGAVTSPLSSHPGVADLVADRYRRHPTGRHPIDRSTGRQV